MLLDEILLGRRFLTDGVRLGGLALEPCGFLDPPAVATPLDDFVANEVSVGLALGQLDLHALGASALHDHGVANADAALRLHQRALQVDAPEHPFTAFRLELDEVREPALGGELVLCGAVVKQPARDAIRWLL